MLNQLALLDDTETRLQFVTICHNQYGQMIDDYMMEMPRENQLLSQFKRDLGQHYAEKLQAGELRRYSTYLFVGIEPIVEFSERIKRVRRNERRASWMEGVSTLHQRHAGAVDGGRGPHHRGRMEHRHQHPVQIGSTDHVHLESRRDPSQAHAVGRLDRNPLLVVQSQILHRRSTPPAIDPLNPKPITSYIVQSQMEVDTKHGWLRMDGMFRRLLYLHEPPSMLQFGMLLPQLLAPGFVSGAFAVECRSSDANKRLRKLKNRRLQVLGRVEKQPELRRTLEEIESEIDELASGKDRPWTAAHSIHLWAESLDYLNSLVLEQRQFGQQNEGMTWLHETTPIFPLLHKDHPGYLERQGSLPGSRLLLEPVVHPLPAIYIPDGTDSRPAVLFKTRYGTLYNFDTHDQKTLVNYNMMIAGSSGSGKSVAANLILLQNMAAGARCVGVDIGGSYQKLCHVLGGNYITMDLDTERNRMNFLYAPPGEMPGEEEILRLRS